MYVSFLQNMNKLVRVPLSKLMVLFVTTKTDGQVINSLKNILVSLMTTEQGPLLFSLIRLILDYAEDWLWCYSSILGWGFHQRAPLLVLELKKSFAVLPIKVKWLRYRVGRFQ